MKKVLIFLGIVIVGCSGTRSVSNDKPRGLYDILTQQSMGGASIQFYEILSKPEEISMLLGDDNLNGKISADDVNTANFLVLNMGEKPSGGYSITVSNVTETNENILVTVAEKVPEPGSMNTMAVTTPYTIVRINSKKPIIIE